MRSFGGDFVSWWFGSLKFMRFVGKYIEIDVDFNVFMCFLFFILILMRIDRRLIIGGIFKFLGCIFLMMDINFYGMF